MGDNIERIAIGALRTDSSDLCELLVGTDCDDCLRDSDGVCDGVLMSTGVMTCESVGWISGMCVTVLALSTPIASTKPYCL
jgi:hypothetical protein